MRAWQKLVLSVWIAWACLHCAGARADGLLPMTSGIAGQLKKATGTSEPETIFNHLDGTVKEGEALQVTGVQAGAALGQIAIRSSILVSRRGMLRPETDVLANAFRGRNLPRALPIARLSMTAPATGSATQQTGPAWSLAPLDSEQGIRPATAAAHELAFRSKFFSGSAGYASISPTFEAGSQSDREVERVLGSGWRNLVGTTRMNYAWQLTPMKSLSLAQNVQWDRQDKPGPQQGWSHAVKSFTVGEKMRGGAVDYATTSDLLQDRDGRDLLLTEVEKLALSQALPLAGAPLQLSFTANDNHSMIRLPGHKQFGQTSFNNATAFTLNWRQTAFKLQRNSDALCNNQDVSKNADGALLLLTQVNTMSLDQTLPLAGAPLKLAWNSTDTHSINRLPGHKDNGITSFTGVDNLNLDWRKTSLKFQSTDQTLINLAEERTLNRANVISFAQPWRLDRFHLQTNYQLTRRMTQAGKSAPVSTTLHDITANVTADKLVNLQSNYLSEGSSATTGREAVKLVFSSPRLPGVNVRYESARGHQGNSTDRTSTVWGQLPPLKLRGNTRVQVENTLRGMGPGKRVRGTQMRAQSQPMKSLKLEADYLVLSGMGTANKDVLNATATWQLPWGLTLQGRSVSPAVDKPNDPHRIGFALANSSKSRAHWSYAYIQQRAPQRHMRPETLADCTYKLGKNQQLHLNLNSQDGRPNEWHGELSTVVARTTVQAAYTANPFVPDKKAVVPGETLQLTLSRPLSKSLKATCALHHRWGGGSGQAPVGFDFRLNGKISETRGLNLAVLYDEQSNAARTSSKLRYLVGYDWQIGTDAQLALSATNAPRLKDFASVRNYTGRLQDTELWVELRLPF